MRSIWRVVCRGAPGVALGVFLCGDVALAQQLSTYEQLSVTGTAVGITRTVTNPTGGSQMTRCDVRVESLGVRYRDDGTDPTASVGAPLDHTDTLTITSNVIARRIRFIRSASAGTALVNVRCYP